jgi:hypothetical protein
MLINRLIITGLVLILLFFGPYLSEVFVARFASFSSSILTLWQTKCPSYLHIVKITLDLLVILEFSQQKEYENF